MALSSSSARLAVLVLFVMGGVGSAHADAFGGQKAAAAAGTSDLNARLDRLEKRLNTISEQQQHLQQQQSQAPVVLKGITPMSTDAAAAEDEEPELPFTYFGEVNGQVLVLSNEKRLLMTKAEYKKFRDAAIARARKAASEKDGDTAGGAKLGITPAPDLKNSKVLPPPPVPPAPAPAQSTAAPAPVSAAPAATPAPAYQPKRPTASLKPLSAASAAATPPAAK